MITKLLLIAVSMFIGWWLRALTSKSDFDLQDYEIYNPPFKDAELLILKQTAENKRHYDHYVATRTRHDRKVIRNDYAKTIDAIRDNPDLKDCVTPEDLAEIAAAYEEYEIECDKLGEKIRLTKEEYLIQQRNIIACIDFSDRMFIDIGLGFYQIFYEPAAKYANGDMNKMIEQEFKENWY